MNLTKPVVLLSTLCMAVAPAMAKVDHGTPALLQSLPQYGVSISLNPTQCDGSYHGSFHTRTKNFIVCYKGTPNANDHDTVRHEAMHVAQNCAAKRDGYPNGIRTILRGTTLKNFITNSLTDKELVGIKSSYPKDRWLTEMEAFAGAKVYTSTQVARIVSLWCNS